MQVYYCFCNFPACSSDAFYCNSTTSQCIRLTDVCDGISDCPQGEDEIGCDTSTISNTCENGGTRTDGSDANTCTCDARYTGSLCQTDLGACEGEPCANGGVCIAPGFDNSTEFQCFCSDPATTGDLCDIGTFLGSIPYI